MTRMTVNEIRPDVVVTNNQTGGTFQATTLVGTSNGYPKTVNIRSQHLQHPNNSRLKSNIDAIIGRLPLEVDLVYTPVTANGRTFDSLSAVTEVTADSPPPAPQAAKGGYSSGGRPAPRADNNVVSKKDIAIALSVGLKAAVELINGGKADIDNIRALSISLANITLEPYGVTTDGEASE